MSELGRYKKALDEVMGRMNTCCRATDFDAAQRAVVAILNPQEFEEVEVVRWLCLHCRVTTMHDTNEPPDGNYCCQQHVGHTKLTGTIRRPVPQKVERSVSVEAMIGDGTAYTKGAGIAVGKGGRTQLIEFAEHPECHGKRGVLTFSWEE